MIRESMFEWEGIDRRVDLDHCSTPAVTSARHPLGTRVRLCGILTFLTLTTEEPDESDI